MNVQTQSYLDEMKEMYEVIIHKCIDDGELSFTDKLFLELYLRTIGV